MSRLNGCSVKPKREGRGRAITGAIRHPRIRVISGAICHAPTGIRFEGERTCLLNSINKELEVLKSVVDGGLIDALAELERDGLTICVE